MPFALVILTEFVALVSRDVLPLLIPIVEQILQFSLAVPLVTGEYAGQTHDVAHVIVNRYYLSVFHLTYFFCSFLVPMLCSFRKASFGVIFFALPWRSSPLSFETPWS